MESTWFNLFDPGESSILHVLMPNHFHGVIALEKESLNEIDHADFKQRRRMRIPMLIGNKMLTSKRINDYLETLGDDRLFKWQRNYYDRVIRSDVELQNVYDYIKANPYNWDEDILKDSNYKPDSIKAFLQ